MEYVVIPVYMEQRLHGYSILKQSYLAPKGAVLNYYGQSHFTCHMTYVTISESPKETELNKSEDIIRLE